MSVWRQRLMAWIKRRPNFSISIGIHVVLVVVLVVAGSTAVHEYRLSSNAKPVVQASLVAQAQLKPQPKPKPNVNRVKERAQAQKREKERLEKIRVAKLKKERLRKEKIAKERKKKALEAKKRRAKALAEKKKAEKLKQQKVAREKKLKEQAMQNLLAKIAQQQKAAEAAAAYQQQLLTAKEKYIALVTQIIRSNWINQYSSTDYQVTLKINVDQKGDVDSVSVVKSSGNSAFDRQAALAVKKSSPLPVPKQKPLQNEMRSMTLAFSNLS